MRPVLMLILLALPGLALAQSRSQVVDGVDRFVLGQFDRIQAQSVAENRQYCGLVAFDAEAKLVATKPRAGTATSCQPGSAPGGWDVVATFRTHGAFLDRAESEVPTADELRRSIAARIDDYVATPGGRVWLNLPAEGLTYQVCGRGCVKSDPAARRCESFTPRIQYTLKQLQAREKKPVSGC